MWLLYSIGSCTKPMPGKPTLLNDVESVPAMARLLEADAPMTPKSSKGFSSSRMIAAVSGGPKTPAPLARPVPESMFR